VPHSRPSTTTRLPLACMMSKPSMSCSRLPRSAPSRCANSAMASLPRPTPNFGK
jgi:hypothetical protein